jgi:hypothetical protein
MSGAAGDRVQETPTHIAVAPSIARKGVERMDGATRSSQGRRLLAMGPWPAT